MRTYRQGELIFLEIEKMPNWVKDKILTNKKQLGKVIREGEITGHKHEITNQGAVLVENSDNSFYNYDDEKQKDFKLPAGTMFLTSKNTIKIEHPEHKTLTLPKGDFVVRIQREYDEDRDRRVRD